MIDMVKARGSDLILHAHSAPWFRVDGELVEQKERGVLEPEALEKMCYEILTERQVKNFEDEMELDTAHIIDGVSRFRVNMFRQRGTIGAAFRCIPFEVPTIEQVGLPVKIGHYFSERPRGFVLVTGPTGCGKSTTLAALINHVNATKAQHIMTIEDPIEYVHEDQTALVNQRELGVDTYGFQAALKHVLRQDPDVILVGEMRDLETMQLAITAAETGHLVFATLHTTNAVQTIDRIIDVFPPYQQQQVRMQLSVNLVGVISQALLKRSEGKGRIAAWEIMLCIWSIRNLIREAKTYQIHGSIQTGVKHGMMTLDMCLANYVKRGVVTEQDALLKSSDPDEFRRLLHGDEEDRAQAGQGGNRGRQQAR
ncbi:MAG: PilT/PilU family type 4a pilus ATPase [Armatimonadia bacterium]|nr:PilT/PilU family type 4a pilus ATPase [Armatimonadia bacterium]